MEPFRPLTRSQAHALDRIRRLGELHFCGVASQLPVRPRLWPLLVGPTGAGKSFLARTAAARLGAHYLPLSFGGWIAMGARQVATAYTILHTALDCPRLVVHLDELDKLPVGRVGDWAQAVANEVWALLDGQLPVERFANDPELRAVLHDEERERLLREGVMHRLFLVGSGTWQSTYDESVAPPPAVITGFGRQSDGGTKMDDACEIVVRALESVRGPSSELLARFDARMLYIAPPTQDEALMIVRRLGLLDSSSYAGAGEVASELARLLPRQGFRAIESVVTEALLRGWRPERTKGPANAAPAGPGG